MIRQASPATHLTDKKRCILLLKHKDEGLRFFKAVERSGNLRKQQHPQQYNCPSLVSEPTHGTTGGMRAMRVHITQDLHCKQKTILARELFSSACGDAVLRARSRDERSLVHKPACSSSLTVGTLGGGDRGGRPGCLPSFHWPFVI